MGSGLILSLSFALRAFAFPTPFEFLFVLPRCVVWRFNVVVVFYSFVFLSPTTKIQMTGYRDTDYLHFSFVPFQHSPINVYAHVISMYTERARAARQFSFSREFYLHVFSLFGFGCSSLKLELNNNVNDINSLVYESVGVCVSMFVWNNWIGSLSRLEREKERVREAKMTSEWENHLKKVCNKMSQPVGTVRQFQDPFVLDAAWLCAIHEHMNSQSSLAEDTNRRRNEKKTEGKWGSEKDP